MNRPYVICHMTMSIDGKVTGEFLQKEECQTAIDEYYRLHRTFPAEAFACGRVTMEESCTGGWYPDLKEFENKSVAREDHIADRNACRYAVVFDRRGRLGWKKAELDDDDPGYDGAHIIEVICEDVPDAYLAYLQSIGVSYIFAGEAEMDLETALEKLWNYFSIRTLLLEGGSEINGAFERAGLIDELSLVQAAVVASADAKPLFLDSIGSEFRLKHVKTLSDGVLWTCFRKKNAHMRTIKMSALTDAMEIDSDIAIGYYDLDEEKNVYLAESLLPDSERERELAELIEQEPDRFVRLPQHNDIPEYEMMEDFVAGLDDKKIQSELHQALQGQQVFGRFKYAVRHADLGEQWYNFRERAYEEFALQWCEKNGIHCEMDI